MREKTHFEINEAMNLLDFPTLLKGHVNLTTIEHYRLLNEFA